MADDTKRLRCRSTLNFTGVSVGDVVLVDPGDPWMARMIPHILVPLEPWPPPVEPEAAPSAPPEAPESRGDDPQGLDARPELA